MLVHAHDGGIDHLHRRIVTSGQRIHDPVANASPPPPNEATRTASWSHPSGGGQQFITSPMGVAALCVTWCAYSPKTRLVMP